MGIPVRAAAPQLNRLVADGCHAAADAGRLTGRLLTHIMLDTGRGHWRGFQMYRRPAPIERGSGWSFAKERRTMRKIIPLTLVSTLLMFLASDALAEGSTAAGKRKSEDCADCHGPDGRGDGDTIPAIAGMPVEKFLKAMQDFESGVRKKSMMMTKQGKKLSDDDVADLAAYYSQLER